MPVEVLHAARARAGVVLMPDVTGVDEALRERAARLVGAGYDVAMPSRWWRTARPPMGDAVQIEAAVARVGDFEAVSDIAAARDRLSAARPRFVMGYSLGGLHARMAACITTGFAGAIDFGGSIGYATITISKPAQPLDLLPGLACPVLFHFGEEDPGVSAAQIAELRRRLAVLAPTALVFTYPGCGAVRAGSGGPLWNVGADTLAWARSVTFLHHLVAAAG